MAKKIRELIPYVVIIVVVILVRAFIVTPVTVEGPSMESTLYTKDVMLLYKFNKYRIKRYDIIVFDRGKTKLVKRLIALPGETIKCQNGIIYINGEEMSNEYGYGQNRDFDEVKLSEDEYFVIGDNREDSLDSRFFGPVHISQIEGNTNFILSPINRIGLVK